MSTDRDDLHEAAGSVSGKGDGAPPSSERRQPRDTRFKAGQSGNKRGRPPKQIEAREHDNPAVHHLMKQVKVTGTNGSVIKGRVLDLFCMRLATMALKGDIRAFDKLIEIAGGVQAVAFMFMDIYRSERLRDDEPDPDEGGPGSDAPPDRGDGDEGDSDSRGSGGPDHGEDNGRLTREELMGVVDPNDQTIWNRVKAVYQKLAEQKAAEKEARAPVADKVRKRHRKNEPDYFHNNKLVDEFDDIQRRLADPEYVHKPHIQAARKWEEPPSEIEYLEELHYADRQTANEVSEGSEIEWGSEAEILRNGSDFAAEAAPNESMPGPLREQVPDTEVSSTVGEEARFASDQSGDTPWRVYIDEKGRRCVEV